MVVKIWLGSLIFHCRGPGCESQARFQVQLLADGHREMTQALRILPLLSSRLLTSAWPRPGCCQGHWESEPTGGRPLSSLSFSLSISGSLPFQINKNRTKSSVLERQLYSCVHHSTTHNIPLRGSLCIECYRMRAD